MKKIKLSILFFIFYFSVFSQTNTEAITFLNQNCNNWAEERIAKGTFDLRLRFELFDSILFIKEYTPAIYYPAEAFYIYIKLSEIEKIEYDNRTFNICTKPNGMKAFIKYKNKDDMEEFDPSKHYWCYDGIKLRNAPETTERSERITKALKFLAENNGAILKKSSF
jgi:hypothetical protein